MIKKKVLIEGDIVCSYDSSNILFSKYSKGSESLVITFKRGAQYRYSDINESMYNEFETAESQGVYFNKVIKQKTFTSIGVADVELIIESINTAGSKPEDPLKQLETQIQTTFELALIEKKTKGKFDPNTLNSIAYFIEKFNIQNK